MFDNYIISMNRYKVVKNIVSGNYDTSIEKFISVYDRIFKWIVSNNREATLFINIYSFDFMLIYNDDANILNPYFNEDKFILHINKNKSHRYGCNIVKWVRDLHKISIEISNYVINGITEMIIDYII